MLEIVIAAVIGAVISVAGFGLFVVAHYSIRRRLDAVAVYLYEQWLAFVAPLIGGIVGVAIAIEVVTTGILIVVIGGVIGGVEVPILESITGEKGTRSASDIIPLAVPGIVYGAINGVILALFFEILRVIGWV